MIIKKIKILSIYFICFNIGLVFAQSDNYPNSPFPDKITTINFQHTSFTSHMHGESLLYNYPGFMSDFGSLTYNYKNSNDDSYFMSIGLSYLMLGANKSIVQLDSTIIYLNGSIGTGYFGNLGISFYNTINRISQYEISVSIFFHAGSGSMFDYYSPASAFYTRGIVGNVFYSIDLFKYFTFSISSGIAYYQIRAMQDENNSNSNGYIYVTYKQEKEVSELKNPIWLGHIVIPWGFAISVRI